MTKLEDPDIVAALVRSRDVEPIPMAERYRELQRRTRLDFKASIRLMELLPVFTDGDQHKANRRKMARTLLATKALQEEIAVKQMDRLLKRLLHDAGDVELVSRFAKPLWQKISGAIAPGLENFMDLVDELPSLFFPKLALRRRVQINERIEAFINANPADIEDRLSNLSLAVLGAKPFIGSLTLSIYRVISNNTGRTSNQIVWPGVFPESSVVFVDRICKRDVEIGDRLFEKRSGVRCVIHDDSYSDDFNKGSLFGLGMHTCLGKGISEFCWRILVEELAKIDAFLSPVSLQINEHTEPFYMPLTAWIRVTERGSSKTVNNES